MDQVKFNMQRARAICEKCQSRDDSIDHDYWNAHAASVLPAALDRIEELESDCRGMKKARDEWIEAENLSRLKMSEMAADADCSDIVAALEDAGISMGDSEQPQDIVTAIGILANRIAELEQAPCEAEARSLLNFQRYDALRDAFMLGETTWIESPSWDDLSEEERGIRIDFARRGLRAEGKL